MLIAKILYFLHTFAYPFLQQTSKKLINIEPIYQAVSLSGRKQPSFQSLLNLLISHNRSKRGFFLNRHIPINSCSFSVDWSVNWCKWCRSFYPRSRNATYSLDTLLYSLLKYESRPSNSDCLPFDNAGSVYVAQPPFYEASLPDSKPLSKPDLQNYGEIWLEPISHDTELREQLRGTYRVYEHWVENNFGNRFSLDTYGVKWLAFSNK